jgi:hypothetical protein
MADDDTPFDPEDEDFSKRWLNRAGLPGQHADLAAMQEQQEQAKDLRGVAGTPPEGNWWDPQRTDQEGRIEDQRGMTAPQADLQARFQRSRGIIRPDYPIPEEPIAQNKGGYYSKDVPMTPLYPGMSDLPAKGEGPEGKLTPDQSRDYVFQHDLKGHFSPNTTPLDDMNDYLNYLKWAHAGGKNTAEEEHDYDLRGYYKAGGQLAPAGSQSHLPDTFKKPNHPTFSDESKYSGPGNEGGHWITDKKGNYVGFQAGAGNLQYHSPQDMQDYFDKYEPGIQLHFPPGTEGAEDLTHSMEAKRRVFMEEYNKRQAKKRGQ